MRLVLAVVIALGGQAAASDEKMLMSVGGGVDTGDAAGFTLRFANVQVTERPSGLIYGGISGYEYWRASDGSGFDIPVGGFVGTHVGPAISTLGGGVGILAFESTHGDEGFGVVPYVSATLGYEVSDNRAVTLDVRLSRHVLIEAPDFTRWSIAVMWGTAIGR